MTTIDIPTQHNGTISELAVANLFLKNNFDVFRSISVNSHFDLVVHDRDTARAFKIEVKTGKQEHDKDYIPIARHREDKHDLLAVHVKNTGAIYLFKSRSKTTFYPAEYISPMISLMVDFKNFTLDGLTESRGVIYD